MIQWSTQSLYQSPLFNKLTGQGTSNSLEESLFHKSFFKHFLKFLGSGIYETPLNNSWYFRKVINIPHLKAAAADMRCFGRN